MKCDEKPRNFIQSTERIKALTDGVFAIAMTLLVLSIEMPEAHSLDGDFFVIELLVRQFDLLYNYFLSFILLAFFWMVHHNQFHYYTETDSTHLWINIFLLMFVALVPFSTVLVGDYPQYGAADLVFATNIILISFLNYFTFWYAKKRRFLLPDLPKYINIQVRKRALLVIGVCLIAIALAIVFPPASSLSFLLIPVLLILPFFRYCFCNTDSELVN